MTVWVVLGAIAAALVLLSLVRVGGTVEYSRSGVLIRLRAGPLRIRVYPPRPKKADGQEKPKRVKKKPKPEEEQPEPKPGGQLGPLKAILPLVADAAGQLRRKVRVDRLLLDVTAAASDPAAAALAFGGVNAAIGMIWPLLENNFNIGDRRIRTRVDFNLTEPEIYLYGSFSLRLGQAAALALRLGIRFLKLWSGRNQEQTKKEAV
ncbi:DUF2953 domain-containing protein [Pseudoflavonifractor capillosus]|uniref:DUF2953 domain-containing protein n=1 Tax=Pseudoflavonifractor capillosus TaxID=106588 RepID=A0A921MLH7_9FIRM|nr:DUF2953 domain-containing protein [Pseudoflavonifractor capillosus]HJG86417.1 DUF2953 domain-containing protein [Pseudoflavonifractor capillosus]